MKKKICATAALIALLSTFALSTPALANTESTTDRGVTSVAPRASFNVEVNIASYIFYSQIEVWANGKKFYGDAGGVGLPGPAKGWGTLSTDDFDRLVKLTNSFQINSLAVGVNILFYGPGTELLGSALVGGIGSAVGIFGGSGRWS
ncbi:VapA/VapB family virulence-associated protein [Lysinibacter sp. HNR]|uniref:VapA/VapB family virulence-associated protein n=1 Tax=Lysinibacter sp. HNR TaxID=3031408 RepID=UPI0024356692|nr:VapA/VapB family virulence-associated protein [Lysinibacter sp. HNR]WGD37460.1 VapA/VapB family virulence-associated protein [Lysinibacter sp. HNR]